MRYGIFSDVHANLEALEAVLEAYQSEAIDKYICAGDLVGYGADPDECVAKLKTLGISVVAGNHDWASVNFFSEENFNPLARQALAWTKTCLKEKSRDYLESLKLVFQDEGLTVVHSSLYKPQDFGYILNDYDARDTFGLLETNLCFIGHTHVPGVYIKDMLDNVFYKEDSVVTLQKYDTYIINAGSVGQPRDGNPDACFCVYDTEKNMVHFKRVKYNVCQAREKIIARGLPEYLGDRLLTGK